MEDQQRIPWEFVCGCTIIWMSASTQEYFDRLKTDERRQRAMKNHYEKHGADYTYDVDCVRCNGSGDTRNKLDGK